MRKTTKRFSWENGYETVKRLSRSFDTLDQAKRFAEGKPVTDIYVAKGRYKVEWVKITANAE